MSVTTTNNLIIPEVVSSLIDGSLGDGVTLLPLAEQDDTLVGQPGDTLKFPVFSYIGKAAVVAENGQIVVAMIDEEATVKRFYKEHGHFRLQPENDAYAPIIVDELVVLGRVKFVIRQYY